MTFRTLAICCLVACCTADTVTPMLVSVQVHSDTVVLDSLDTKTGAAVQLTAFESILPFGDINSFYDASSTTLHIPGNQEKNTILANYDVAANTSKVISTSMFAMISMGSYKGQQYAFGQYRSNATFYVGKADFETGSFTPVSAALAPGLSYQTVDTFDSDEGVFYVQMGNMTTRELLLLTVSVTTGKATITGVQTGWQLSALEYDSSAHSVVGIVYKVSEASYYFAKVKEDASVTPAGIAYPFATHSCLIGVGAFDPNTSMFSLIFFDQQGENTASTSSYLAGIQRGSAPDALTPYLYTINAQDAKATSDHPVTSNGILELAYVY